jgi:hypothetical protein
VGPPHCAAAPLLSRADAQLSRPLPHPNRSAWRIGVAAIMDGR